MNIMQMESGIMNMKQENKDLLFKDLSARLPYHVKVKIWLKDGTTEEGALDLEHNYADVLLNVFYYNKIKDIKPYLRPISSMTMEEDEQRIQLGIWKSNQYDGQIIGIFQDIPYCSPQNFQSALIWLLQNHFDIFGLIPKGLALEAPEGMYNL